MTRKELKLSAKQALKGKVFSAFLPVLIVIGISGVFSLISGLIREYAGIGINAIWGLVSIAISVLMMPLNFGLMVFFLNFAEHGGAEVKDVFQGYKSGSYMAERIKATILVTLYVFLGFICLIIPGIILAFKYSQIGFAFAENPDATYRDAMKRSAELMKGRKFEFFVLGLSFILWFILAPFTLFLIYIYLIPYIQLTFAKYYIEISGMNKVQGDGGTAAGTSDDGIFSDSNGDAGTQPPSAGALESPEQNSPDREDNGIF